MNDEISEDQSPVRPAVRFTHYLDTNLAAGPSWFVVDHQTLFQGIAQRSYGGRSEAEAAARAALLNTIRPLLDKPFESHDYTRNQHPSWYADEPEERVMVTKLCWPLVTQETVERIIQRARQSPYGLGDGLIHKQGHLSLRNYGTHDLDALAQLLVNGYDDKYDLVSVFRAALEEVDAFYRRSDI